jgi:hypothetical protein
LVERDLPKVDVASSNLVIRSESFRTAKPGGKTSKTDHTSRSWKSRRVPPLDRPHRVSTSSTGEPTAPGRDTLDRRTDRPGLDTLDRRTDRAGSRTLDRRSTAPALRFL